MIKLFSQRAFSRLPFISIPKYYFNQTIKEDEIIHDPRYETVLAAEHYKLKNYFLFMVDKVLKNYKKENIEQLQSFLIVLKDFLKQVILKIKKNGLMFLVGI